MAQPAETFDAFDAIGNREDLADRIWDISPTDTPFMANIGRATATAINHEWQTDELSAVDTSNAQIQGGDAAGDAIAPTVRVGNRTQISQKTVIIAGTQEAVDKAGRSSEVAYQVAKKGKELKRDMEAIMSRNQASAIGNSTTAAELGSFEAWLTSNVDRGVGGASGGASGSVVTAATDGTQRAFTESLLSTVLQSIFTNGGNADMLMLGSFNKTVASGFTGNATKTLDTREKKIIAAADVYVSDFGQLQIVPNRFQRDRTALVIDTEMAAVAELRPFMVNDLAKTGDSEKKQLLTEYTLEVRNEAAHGVIADLTTS